MNTADHLKSIRERVEISDDTNDLAHVARTDTVRLLDALERVLAIHAPTEDNPPQCSECPDYWYPSQNVHYPCETVTAITTALEGK